MRRDGSPGAVLRLVAVVLALTLAACSSSNDGGSNSGAQAGVPSALTDLPKPAAATASGSATEAGGTWTQSFEVEGLDAPGVMAFYEQALPGDGWEVESPTTSDGQDAYTATYTSAEDGTLVVTANAFSGAGGGTPAQLNLQLTPAG
jgi:hypothetical protein